MDTSSTKNKLSIQRPKNTQQKKNKKRRSRRNKGKTVITKTLEFRSQAVPYARATKTINQGARLIQNGKDGVIINHSELFDSLITDAANLQDTHGDIIWYWTIQPAFKELFPYLSRHALLYEFYRIRSLSFTFKTQSNAGTDGLVVMGYDLDPHDVVPSSDLAGRQTLMTMEGSVSGSVWQDLTMHVQPRHLKDRFLSYPKGLYVRSEGETASDSRFADFGNVYIGTFGTGANLKTLGDLYVSYEIELRVAQIHNAVPATAGQERPGESRVLLTTTVSETGSAGIKTNSIPETVVVAPNVVTYGGSKLVELLAVDGDNIYKSNFTGLRPMELEVDFGANTFFNAGFPNNTYMVRQILDPVTKVWSADVEQPTEPSTLNTLGTWVRNQLATFGDYGLSGKYVYRAFVHWAEGRIYRFVLNNSGNAYAASVALTLLTAYSKTLNAETSLIPAGTVQGVPNYLFNPTKFIPTIAASAGSSSSVTEKPASHCGTKDAQGRRETIPGGLKATILNPH
jgi:hypothetical protein